MEAAINADANVPAFILQFHPQFPVGTASQLGALEYLQMSPMVRAFVPYVVFIDRKGMIRAQYTGTDIPDDQIDKIFREQAGKLLSEGVATAKPQRKRPAR